MIKPCLWPRIEFFSFGAKNPSIVIPQQPFNSGGRERLLREKVSASTAPTTSSDPETLARKYMTSPQKLQRTGQLFSEVPHRNLSIMPLVHRSLQDPTFLILYYSPCPTVCPRAWGVIFISCFHIFRLQPSSLHCWLAAPLGDQFSTFAQDFHHF